MNPDEVLPLPDGLDAAPHVLIALDYDGTLAPFHEEPARAQPLAGIVPLVLALARLPRLSVAIVSGRPIAELERFLAAPDQPSAPLILIGEHGWERRDGPRQRRKTMSAGLEQRLEAAYRAARETPAGERIERKRSALVLHLRGVDAREAAALARACQAAWAALGDAPSDPADALRLEPIDGGLELRAVAHDKGTVLGELVALLPPGTFTVYAGDDRTDEDAFRVLSREHEPLAGFGVRVAREPRETAAHATLPSCEALRDWLERLHRHLEWRLQEERAG